MHGSNGSSVAGRSRVGSSPKRPWGGAGVTLEAGLRWARAAPKASIEGVLGPLWDQGLPQEQDLVWGAGTTPEGRAGGWVHLWAWGAIAMAGAGFGEGGGREPPQARIGGLWGRDQSAGQGHRWGTRQ